MTTPWGDGPHADGPGPYPAPPEQHQLATPSWAMAGWSLGLALAGLTPIAFGLAIAVLVRSRRDGRDHGKALAIAALLSGVVVTGLVVAIVLGGWDETRRDSDGRVTSPGKVTIDRLHIGDCVSDYQTVEEVEAGEWVTGELTVVPCEQPHTAEVFAINTLDPDDYIDQESLDHASVRTCRRDFGDYVGVPYEQSSYDLIYYNPTIGAPLQGDEVTCLVTDPSGPRTQLIKGSEAPKSDT